MSWLLRAGEPIRVGSPTFGPDGAPTLWPAAGFPIQYTTDQGPLGLDTEAATQTRVVGLFNDWQNVTTSNITFNRSGFIISNAAAATCVDGGAGGDGDVNTIGEFNCLAGLSPPFLSPPFPGNPVIYDNSGAIHTALFGAGTSVLGFAGPVFSTAGGGTIVAARAVLNGAFRDGVAPDSADTEFEGTILHELGHYIGLGHSQVNVNCLSGCANFSDDTFGLPTMFPFLISGLRESAGPPSVAPSRTLSVDDIGWVSRLYPDASFATTHATISGTVFFSDGVTHLQEINVIAREVDNLATPAINESRRNAVSGVSGYLYAANRGLGTGFLNASNTAPYNPGSNRGSRNPALRGTYDIPVPAGVSYNVEVEAINPGFVGGSSVGPIGREIGEQFGLPGTSPPPVNVGPIAAGSTAGGNSHIFTGTAATRDSFDAAATNDTVATFTPIGNGTTSASISPFGNVSATEPDVDVYAFTALANTTVTIDIVARNITPAPAVPSTLDPIIEIVDSSGARVSLCDTDVDAVDGVFDDPCMNDDVTSGVNIDSRLNFRSASGGTFLARVLDFRGDARPDSIYNLTMSGAGQAPPPPGCTSDFDGGTGTDWNTAANWNPDGVPTGAVCIGSTFTVNHAAMTNTVASLQNVAGTLNVSGGTLTVTGSAAVGGTLNASGTGTVNLGASNISNLTMNGGTVNFNGPVASILSLTFNNGTLNASGGTVNLPSYTQAGGTLRLNGGSVTSGTITQNGGLIEGTGSLNANVVQNAGTLGPGLSPGILTLTGNFTQNTGPGIILFEIGGTTAGTQYDRVNISGNAVQNATVNITLISGFVPSIGDTFTLATFASGTGTGTTNFPPLPAGRQWVDISTATEFIVQVQAVTGCPLGAVQYDGGPTGTGTAFDLAANWAGDVFPTNQDACINIAVAVTYAAANQAVVTLNSLTVTNTAGLFTQSAGTLTLNGPTASSIGTNGFSLSGGTLTGTGNLTVTGPVNWSGGTMSGGGATTVSSPLNITAAVTLDNRTLTNNGTANLAVGASLLTQNAVTINNAAGATFNAQGDGVADFGGTGARVFNNAGIFTSTSAGAFTFSVALNNTGTVNANTGTVIVNTGTSPGTFNVAAAATLQFNSSHEANGPITGAGTVIFGGGVGTQINLRGNYNVTGNTTISNSGNVNFLLASTVTSVGTLTVTGGTTAFSSGNTISPVGTFAQSGGIVQGNDNLTIAGIYNWTGGSMGGLGVTNVNGTLTVAGIASAPQLFRTLNNSGTGNWTSQGFSVETGGIFNNTATGTFNIQSAGSFGGAFTAGTVNNAGTMNKSAGAGNTVTAAFNNSGTFNVNTGTLSFTNTFTQTAGVTNLNGGTLSTATTLTFNGGTLNSLAGTPGSTITGSVSNAGATIAPGASPGILTVATPGNYTQTAGALNIEINGLTPGTQHDQMVLAGAATLGGTLNVTVGGGFTPVSGNAFTIMTFASRTGTFATVNFPAAPAGLQWNITYNPTTVVLSLSTLAPAVSLNPTNVAFGNQRVGTTSSNTAVTLTNTGTANLNVTGITLAGADAGQFGLVTSPAGGFTCPAGANTLAPNASCTFGVNFAPTSTSAKSANVSIASDAAGSPHSVPLTGTGIAPAVTLNPTNVAFANQLINTISATQVVTVQNTGTDTLNISAIAKAGTDPTQFNLVAPGTGTPCNLAGATQVAPAGSCTLGVNFAPTTVGAKSANIAVTSDASGSPHTVPLTGTGVAPAVGLTPTNIAFGDQPVNTTSVTTNVQVSNTGGSTLNISGITKTGTDPTQFNLVAPTGGASPACALVGATAVPAATSCFFGVNFAPTTTGAKNANASIASDASGSPHTVPLTGNGIAATITLTPNPVPFGGQRVGTTSATQTVTVTNNGTASANITGITLTGADAAHFNLFGQGTAPFTCPLGASSLGPSSSCTLGANFAPTTTGAKSANVSVVSDATGSPHTTLLTGNGTQSQATPAPASVDFGDQVITTTSAPRTITVTNGGTATLNIATVVLGGVDAAQFAIVAATTTCNNGTVVNPGANCIINATFTPATIGAKNATG